MKISLIIPAYNEEKYIGDCLQSVQKYAMGRLHEVIVVDNASTDNTAAVAGQFPGVKIVREEHKGLTHARQAGLEGATGDIIAYIDADTRISERWLATALGEFEKNEGLVSLSGPARYWDVNAWDRFLIEAGWWITAPLMYQAVGFMIYGANFMAKKSALEAAGGFDKGIEFYGEDTDIARRLSRVGKVKFRMDFYIYSSARRFKTEGIWKTNFVYSLNFLWPALFGRPFTKSPSDVRRKT
jgi:glycosyltransferase involved in cell wall biosynthesis